MAAPEMLVALALQVAAEVASAEVPEEVPTYILAVAVLQVVLP